MQESQWHKTVCCGICWPWAVGLLSFVTSVLLQQCRCSFPKTYMCLDCSLPVHWNDLPRGLFVIIFVTTGWIKCRWHKGSPCGMFTVFVSRIRSITNLDVDLQNADFSWARYFLTIWKLLSCDPIPAEDLRNQKLLASNSIRPSVLTHTVLLLPSFGNRVGEE